MRTLLVLIHVLACAAVYKTVVRGAIRRLKDTGERAPAAASGEDNRWREDAMVRGIVQGLDQRNGKVEVAQVDMEQELRDLGLTQFFPTSQWPPHSPVGSSFVFV